MSKLKFYSRPQKKTIELEFLTEIYLVEVYSKIRTLFNIPKDLSIKLFVIILGKPLILTQDMRISELVEKSDKREFRHIEIFWKQNQHGKQTEDLSPSSFGTVVSGYKRYVSSSEDAGSVMVGDPNGANVVIPSGAIPKGAEISIKTVMTRNSMSGNMSGYRNVTRVVRSDPNKVNDSVNNM